jgi:hypothetical protein
MGVILLWGEQLEKEGLDEGRGKDDMGGVD